MIIDLEQIAIQVFIRQDIEPKNLEELSLKRFGIGRNCQLMLYERAIGSHSTSASLPNVSPKLFSVNPLSLKGQHQRSDRALSCLIYLKDVV
jgi:hypothetical protein